MASPPTDKQQPLYLGLDCSTQSISAVVIDASRAVVYECALRFDDELPEYATTNGVLHHAADPNVVLVPSLMLVDALDRILAKLSNHRDVFKLEDVVCISGSAQQHTSVYWRRGFSLEECVAAADPTRPLAEAIRKANGFSRECGPSWMDSSTTRFCESLESELGGAHHVAAISGSRAYPRFTGNQIAKFLCEDPTFMDTTGRISLASSMMTSLLVGRFTAIDASDASGTNLLNLQTKQWSPELIHATAMHAQPATANERLVEMLDSSVCLPHEVVGSIHGYFQSKFGFRSDCRVVPFSGDNPCTLAGIGLAQAGDVAVSLGTSTTLMAVVDPLDTACAEREGHFFINPIDPHSLMAMICFKNGALAREELRDQFANGTWAEFESLLSQAPPGNEGVVGFFIRDPEITPQTIRAGTMLFDANDVIIDPTGQPQHAAVWTRAIVESQCLALRIHANRLGIRQISRLVATGGGAASDGFLQVLADVFGIPVLRLRSSGNSAALGAAFRAHHGLLCSQERASGFVPFDTSGALHFEQAAIPNAANTPLYDALLLRFEQLESEMIRKLN